MLIDEPMSEMKQLRDEEIKLRTLYRIALDIKAGRLPETFSKKGAELAKKYQGEELEALAYS